MISRQVVVRMGGANLGIDLYSDQLLQSSFYPSFRSRLLVKIRFQFVNTRSRAVGHHEIRPLLVRELVLRAARRHLDGVFVHPQGPDPSVRNLDHTSSHVIWISIPRSNRPGAPVQQCHPFVTPLLTVGDFAHLDVVFRTFPGADILGQIVVDALDFDPVPVGLVGRKVQAHLPDQRIIVRKVRAFVNPEQGFGIKPVGFEQFFQQLLRGKMERNRERHLGDYPGGIFPALFDFELFPTADIVGNVDLCGTVYDYILCVDQRKFGCRFGNHQLNVLV